MSQSLYWQRFIIFSWTNTFVQVSLDAKNIRKFSQPNKFRHWLNQDILVGRIKTAPFVLIFLVEELLKAASGARKPPEAYGLINKMTSEILQKLG